MHRCHPEPQAKDPLAQRSAPKDRGPSRFALRTTLVLALAAPLGTQQPAQWNANVPNNPEIISKIVDEGMRRSHADADLQYLLDVIGPRLSGSPAMRRANEWTQQ